MNESRSDSEIKSNLKRMNYLRSLSLRGKIRFGVSKLKAQTDFALRRPALGWNVLKFWLHHKVSNKARLRTVDMMVTGKCNFECTHCYATQWKHEDVVPLEILGKTIEELISLGVFHFILQGGEPLTDLPRLRAIIKMCRPHRSYVNVVSNGYLLTPEIIQQLKEDGVSKIAVSIDSGIPEEHDQFRNKPGSWQRAVNAMAEIRGAGLQTCISTTVSHTNLHSDGMRQLFRFAREKRYRININPASMAGNWEGRQDVLLTEEDTEYLLQQHLQETSDPHGMALIGRDVFLHHGLVGCPAVKEQVSISSSGDVFPCVFIHTALGNIRDQSIKSMIDSALENKYFCRWNDKCLSGEDREFIGAYVEPFADQAKPLNGRKVYGIEGLCVGNRYQ